MGEAALTGGAGAVLSREGARQVAFRRTCSREPIGAELGRVEGVLARELIGEANGDAFIGFDPGESLVNMGGVGVLEREELTGVEDDEKVWKPVLAEPLLPRVDAKKEETNLEALRGRPREGSRSCACNSSELTPVLCNVSELTPVTGVCGINSGVTSGWRSDWSANRSRLPGMC